jgi:hypothetical protein
VWMLSLLMVPGAQATDVGFLLRPEAAIDLAADRPGEDEAELRTRMRAFANGDLDDGSKWFFEIWGEHQVLSGDDLEAWWDVKPGPTGWRGKTGLWTIEAGHLIERWGKLDLLPVMDVVNPRDLSAGPMTPIEYQRLPLPMVTFAIGEGDLRTATVVVPWAGADRVDSRGTDWSLIRQRMVSRYTAGMAEWPCCFDDLGESIGTLGASLEDQDARFRRSLNLANSERALPGALFYNGEIAQRITLDRPGYDATLTGGWMRTNQAAGTLDPAISGILKDELLPPVTELQDVLGGATSMVLRDHCVPVRRSPVREDVGASDHALVCKARPGHGGHHSARLAPRRQGPGQPHRGVRCVLPGLDDAPHDHLASFG